MTTHALCEVQVEVVAAHDLPTMDATGDADPYCKIEMKETAERTSTQQTVIRYDTLQPRWNQLFAFYFCVDSKMRLKSKKCPIKFTVMDMDLRREELIGTAAIELSFDDHYQPVLQCKKDTPSDEDTKEDEQVMDLGKRHKLRLRYSEEVQEKERKSNKKSYIEINITCECTEVIPVKQGTKTEKNEEKLNDDEVTKTEEKEPKRNEPETSIHKVFTKYHNDLYKERLQRSNNINWIHDNIEDLGDIARKISKREAHKWSINDFSNVDAPPEILHKYFKDYYLEFVEYATNKQFRLVSIDSKAYEVKYDERTMPWEYDERLFDITMLYG